MANCDCCTRPLAGIAVEIDVVSRPVDMTTHRALGDDVKAVTFVVCPGCEEPAMSAMRDGVTA